MQIRGWKDYRRWTGIPVASRTILVSESTRVEKALLRILALDSYRAAIISGGLIGVLAVLYERQPPFAINTFSSQPLFPTNEASQLFPSRPIRHIGQSPDIDVVFRCHQQEHRTHLHPPQ
ncbi:hypothetical protein KCU87_g209, partial [Aureobasidium melanogenum]